MPDADKQSLLVRNRRLHHRHVVNTPIRLSSMSGTMSCRLLDISAGGARLGLDSLSMQAFRSETWHLVFPTGLEIRLRPVWSGRSEAGVAFVIDELTRAEVKRIISIHYQVG